MNKSNPFVSICQEIWVDSYYLIHVCGVPPRTVSNGKTNYAPMKSPSWEWIPNLISNNSTWIKYESIPKNTFNRYPLVYQSYAKRKKVPTLEEIEEKKSQKHILFILAQSGRQYWQHYRQLYSDLGFSQEKTKIYSVTHVIFREAIIFKEKNYNLIDIFLAYLEIQKSQKLAFNTKSKNYHSLKNKINDCQRHGIKNALTHGLSGLPSNNCQFTGYWQYRVDCFYNRQSKPNISSVLEKVNDERLAKNKSIFLHETIRQYLQQRKVKNISQVMRNGDTWLQNNFLPYLLRDTSNVGDIWMIDGTRFPFPVKDSKTGRIVMLWMVTIIDVYSRRIIGVEIDKGETTDLVIKTLYNACRITGHLPKLVLVDNGSAFTSDKAEYFIEKCGEIGCEWQYTKIKKAREKAQIERSYGTLNSSIYNTIPGYLGEGIKSNREDAHPSPEEVKRIREKEVRTYDEAKLLGIKCINLYNNKNFEGKPSKLEKYKSNLTVNTNRKRWVLLEKYHIPMLFFEYTEATSSKCMVKIQFNQKHYHFQIPKRFALEYNGTKTKIYFNPADMSKAYSFCLKTKQFLYEMDREVVIEIDHRYWTAKQQRQVDKKVFTKEFITKSAKSYTQKKKQKLIDSGEYEDPTIDLRIIDSISIGKDDMAQAELQSLLSVGELNVEDFKSTSKDSNENTVSRGIREKKSTKKLKLDNNV